MGGIQKTVRRGWEYFRERGLREAARRTVLHFERKISERRYVRRMMPTEEELAAQRKDCAAWAPRFSVIVPLYNTPMDVLREMIDSVRRQSCENWELCLADGSGEDHPEVGLMMPDIMNPDGTRQILPKHNPSWWYMIAGRFLPAVRKAYCRGDEAMDKPTEIEFCSGCFMMIRTEIFRKLSGFDERYFLYMEDADLSRQVRKQAKVIFFPGARVVHAWHHDSAKSGKALKLHLESARKYFAKWRRDRS